MNDPKTLSAERGAALVQRLVRCVRELGLRLGWRYWRIQNGALVNPWLVLEWADACKRAPPMGGGTADNV